MAARRETGPALRIEAFGEEGDALQVPAPLIRVREGTTIVATIRNALDRTLTVRGLCARDGQPCAPIDVPAAGSREVRFTLGRAGTYHYWATTTGMPLLFRGASDTQLSGAFVVDRRRGRRRCRSRAGHHRLDEPDASTVEGHRGRRRSRRRVRALDPRITFLVNGLSWPATERLTYRLGEKVRWRVVNLSSQRHPMHMHGFYFEVDSLGDGVRDTTYADGHKQRVVTQLLQPGATMAMTWTPERVGNWLFHCHIMHHVSPERRLDARRRRRTPAIMPGMTRRPGWPGWSSA